MMVNIQELKLMPICEIVKVLKLGDSVTVDLSELARTLNLSIVPHNFGTDRVDGEKVMCAFMTNEKGDSCIFYSEDLLNNREFLWRIMIAQSFTKYIITGNNHFFVTESTDFSIRERMLLNEMLMPYVQVKNTLDKLVLPTTFSLSKVFKVPQQFVRQRLSAMHVTRMVAGYNY